MATLGTNQPPQQQQQDAQPDKKTQSPPQPSHVTPNILPCSVHHDGPVPVSRRHWNPIPDDKEKGEKDGQAEDEDEDETSTVYFRGRKLRGRSVRVPEGYHGLLVSAPPTQPPQSQKSQLPPFPDPDCYDEDDHDEEEEEEEEEVIIPPTAHATFTHLQLWNHETLPDVETDAFARGMREWIRFAEGVHGPGPGQGGNGNGNGVVAS